MNIVVSGADGQLAREIKELAPIFQEFNFTFLNKIQWDITNYNQFKTIYHSYNPQIIINCAAYTKVDLAESEMATCFLYNRDALDVLSKQCKLHKIILVHFSSDYVFHSPNATPLKEYDTKNPSGVYARSKSEGEDLILHNLPESLIIRTSWLYSSFGHNFVKTILNISKKQNEIRIVEDQIGSPTYAADLAEASLIILRSVKQAPTTNYFGVYHYSNAGITNWFEFAKEIVRYENLAVEIKSISSQEFNALANRPPYSVLDCSKIKEAFEIEIPDWRLSLHKCLDKLRGS
ncbi:MAG: dTDP-4-dehydrorhamnose reductase [Bacteroidota bacterium]|nr:dTDP-4-dehydrorhamnose reductase [Bacteroidota bacterium]